MITPTPQVFWYTKLPAARVLRDTINTHILIIGGGMAGLVAAHSFVSRGKKVTLIEKNYCGGGASGKSSGFITPDSEVNLAHMIDLYGKAHAKKVWDMGTRGVELIRELIAKFNLDCDYQIQDNCVAANSHAAFKKIQEEHEGRITMGFESRLFDSSTVSTIIGSDDYYGAVLYNGTFGINGYKFCQELKMQLGKMGVDVYEETPATSIAPHEVTTPEGVINAEQIIICADRYTPDIGLLSDEIFHAQTFLTISAPLTDQQIKQVFPSGNIMVCDSDLIFNYFRATPDNRIMLGGASLFNTFDYKENFHPYGVIKKLNRYWQRKFPHVPLTIEYQWPGLIGVSKDIIPIAGKDKHHDSIYYIAGCAGLPWAAALGEYSAESLLEGRRDYDDYFSPYRKWSLPRMIQKIVGKKITFAISNSRTLLR
ncbi:MAG: NAD(P)/FAD-dependent oxidoreductase [Candidatus Dependentiae bacterium]